VLTLPSSVKVYLVVDPVSMHLSFDRLGGMVKRLGLDPTTGHLFVFVNRPKTHMKVLFYDRSGFCQVYKRLDRGTFEIPTDGSGLPLRRELAPAELGLILEGVDLRQRARRVRSGRVEGALRDS
jgi:transposase